MTVYMVYYKDFKTRKGNLLGVLVERRGALRGQTEYESGLKWGVFTFGRSVKDKASIFVVPKRLEARNVPRDLIEKGMFSCQEFQDWVSSAASTRKNRIAPDEAETRAFEESTVLLDDPMNGVPELFPYDKYYGFSESPLEVLRRLKFIYLTPSHRQVLTSVMVAIDDPKGIVSITGEPGTGKTTLIRFLLDNLDRKFRKVLILYSSMPYVELLKTILLELHQDIESESEEGLRSQLHDYLLSKLSDNQVLLVVVDEAQILHEDVLRKVGKLCLLETKLRIILVGHPDMEKKLRAQGLTQSETRFFIRPLNRRESRQYVDHRLKLTGSSIAQTFIPRAIFSVISYAHGIPRVINTLCDNALLRGLILSKRRIDVEIVHEVIRNLEGPVLLRTAPGRIIRAVERFPPVSLALKLLLGS